MRQFLFGIKSISEAKNIFLHSILFLLNNTSLYTFIYYRTENPIRLVGWGFLLIFSCDERISVAQEDFNLSELVDNLITLTKPVLDEHQHNFDIHINHIEHEAVCGDSLRIQQVFVNLRSEEHTSELQSH